MQTEMMAVAQSHKCPSLSVVLLCFNDAATIGTCVHQAYRLRPSVPALQVIVVEDGSSDDSKQVLQDLVLQYPELKVVWHPQNKGYGPSVADGISAALNQFVLCVDGDNQFDLQDAIRLLEFANGCYEIISGCRVPRADPWYRCVVGWVYNRMVRLVFRLPVQDVDCGFKLLQRASAQHLFPAKSKLAVWVEVLIKAEQRSYRCANIAVRHRPRASGQSTVFKFSGIARMAWELISVGVRFKLLDAS